MTCHHRSGDPNCSSTKARGFQSPNSRKFEIIDAHRIGRHLVLKVLYPNCAACSFEGQKVMVFLDINEMDALRWKEIDPHFRETRNAGNSAPSPAARFPATAQGWNDALAYAASKS